MSKVYIIGNGFDLNLGLKTSYKYFLDSEIFQARVNKRNQLIDYLNGINSNLNWIDIERELAQYSRYRANGNFYQDYTELCQLLKTYLSGINLSYLDKNSVAYKLFEATDPSEHIIIINFNYTPTVERILGSNLYQDHCNLEILPIHGSLKSDQIIFGVDDRAEYSRDHSFLLKSSSDAFKGRECKRALENAEKLYIFGHSLGESDHIYFDYFFQNICMLDNDSREVTIYYYGEVERQKIMAQLHDITQNKLSKLRTHTNLKTIDVTKFESQAEAMMEQ